jgi:hypothetical protein
MAYELAQGIDEKDETDQRIVYELLGKNFNEKLEHADEVNIKSKKLGKIAKDDKVTETVKRAAYEFSAGFNPNEKKPDYQPGSYDSKYKQDSNKDALLGGYPNVSQDNK